MTNTSIPGPYDPATYGPQEPPTIGPGGPQPGGPQPQAQQPVAQPGAPKPESAFSMLGRMEPQLAEHSRSVFAELGFNDSMQAQGFWEHALYGTESVAKSFGDAIFNAGSFAVKVASGVTAPFEGRSFVEGYEEAAMIMESDTGTRDPGLYDVFAAVGKDIGLVNQEEMDVGGRRDEVLRARLGNAALFTETAGFIASFAIGAGANLAKLGAPAGKLAEPLARMMAKPAERALGRMAAKNPAEAAKILESGNAWKILTETTEWTKSATMMERVLFSGGRTAQDMMSLTGANIVQSYAMSKDEDRIKQLAAAASISWALLPIGKVGSLFAKKIAMAGMDLPSADMLRGALKRFESGELSARNLAKELWSSSNPLMRGLGNGVASAFEGSMFMGLSPEAHDLYDEWRAGDMDAGAKLQAMWLGSMAGIAVTKGLVPGELAPLFKRIRPDANTLDIRIQAEAIRRSSNDDLLDAVTTKEAAKSFQDPQGSGISTRQTFIHEINVKEGLNPKDVSALEASQEIQRREGRDIEAATIEGETAAAAISLNQKMAAMELDVRNKFEWATEQTTGLLRSGWESAFPSDGSGDVGMTFGRDHTVTMRQGADGEISLLMPASVVKILSDADALPGHPEVVSLSQQKLTGEAALEAIHNLSLVTVARQQEFALNAERLGMEEVMPGVYARADDPMHHYVQLDGTIIRKSPMDNSWAKGRIDIQVVGDMGEPIWNSPVADQLTTLLQVKAALAPESLVDNVLSQSLQMARHGKGPASDELRMFFETLTPEHVHEAMRPGVDDFFAFDLGSLGSGMNNARQLLMERQTVIPEGLTGGVSGRLKMARDARKAAEAVVEGEAPFRKQDTQREGMVARLDGVDPDATSTTRISGRQARVLHRFVPEKSDLGRQIKDMTDIDARDVTVNATDLKKVAEAWVRYAPTERQKRGSTKEVASDIQSADAWVSTALDGLGASPSKPGFGGNPKFIGISEQIGARLRIPKKKQPKHETDIPGMDRVMSGIDGKMVVDTAKAIGRVAKRVGKGIDYMVRDMADNLRRKGNKFGDRVKRVQTKSGMIEGAALEHSKKLQALQSDKSNKAEFNDLLETLNPVGKSTASQRSRFEDLINRRTEPKTELENLVVEHGQAFTVALRDAASDAGSFRSKSSKDGKTSHEPIHKDGPTKTPYVEGKDLHKVMDSPPLRRAFFDEIASINELFREGRRLTGDDLNKDWEARQGDKDTSSNVKKRASVEFTRQFENYPEVWTHDNKPYEIQDPDPFTRHRRIAQREAGRAAMDQEFGVGGKDMDVDQMLKIGAAQGWSKQHMEALGKGGLKSAIDKIHAENVRTLSNDEATSQLDSMEILAARAQGTESVDGLISNRDVERVWSGMQALRASSLSSLSFLRDIPDLARGGQFTGRLMKAARAIAGRAADRKEWTTLMERDGVLQQQLGERVFHEARGILRWTSDKISLLAQMTERLKAKLAIKQIELMVNDINAGKGTDNDFYFLEKLVGLDVRGKTIEGDLKRQVLREGAEFLTSRARKGSYSKFADDPRVGQVLLFQRFATKRLESHIKVIEGVYSTAKESGWGSKQNRSAIKTAIKTATGIVIAGVTGDWLIEGLVGLATEGDLEGFEQFYNEATASQWAALKQLAESVKNQVVGGSAATVTNMFSRPDDIKTWTDFTTPGAFAHAIVVAANEAWKGDSAAGAHLLTNSGLIPAKRLFASWVRSGVMGQDEGVRRASLQVWNWRRDNDLMPATGASKTRPEEFYDAVGSTIRSLTRNGMDSDKAIGEVSEKLRKALDLAPSDSVASSIRGHRMVANLSPQQRQDLFDSINDPDRVKQILQFDEALSDMARAVGQMEGTDPSDFEGTMALVAKQAALGSSDQWREVVDMAVASSVAEFEAGGKDTPQLHEVSRHLAMYPEHLDTVFQGGQLQALQLRDDSMKRADLIWRFLFVRAKDRQFDEKRKKLTKK